MIIEENLKTRLLELQKKLENEYDDLSQYARGYLTGQINIIKDILL